jgi:putative glutamine amidotransferase
MTETNSGLRPPPDRKRPRIGITVGRETIAGRLFDAAPDEYVVSVVEAGGIPLLLVPLPPSLASEAVSGMDGLLLTGGGDINPALYGAIPQPEIENVDPERDASELAIVVAALSQHIPVLGICRGAQLLNVAFGGTLHQHLADEGRLAHQERQRRGDLIHDVTPAAGSLLASLSGLEPFKVNSIHHQAVDVLGRQLRATATAEDGVVEAIESDDGSVLAVQWHPECIADDPVTEALFGWLIEWAGGTQVD